MARAVGQKKLVCRLRDTKSRLSLLGLLRIIARFVGFYSKVYTVKILFQWKKPIVPLLLCWQSG